MGSKKSKRKKVKVKKLEKFHKLKEIKRKKNISCSTLKKIDSEEDLRDSNIIDNRSSPSKHCSSYTPENYTSDVKYFCKIRDDCFSHLQVVVTDNCVFYDSIVSEEMLEKIVLELEQYALLACLQVDIYQKSMLKIVSPVTQFLENLQINDIKKHTEEKQVHKDVIKLLPHSVQEKIDQIIDQSTTNLQNIRTCGGIPTIASTRCNDDLESKDNFWKEQFSSNSDLYYLITNNSLEANAENQNDTQNNLHDNPWNEEENCLFPDQSNYWINEVPQTNKNNFNNSQDDFNNSENINIFLSSSEQSKEKPRKVDPLLLSRNQLQKSVEQTLNESEKVKKQKRDAQERAYIAQILEGEDSLDERLNDSLSDNEYDSKENITEPNLINRLEKMRELFGVEYEENKTDNSLAKQKKNNKTDLVNTQSRRRTIWHYEKFIQLHKYSVIAAEMTLERRNINEKLFIELFGEDSDEEHELEYSSEEKYRLSCTERISSWVVKYLMPFYHNKRILGRNVFKSLGYYISSTIVDKIQYPDEWTVKYFVSKFFPPKKKYICEADILDFQVD